MKKLEGMSNFERASRGIKPSRLRKAALSPRELEVLQGLALGKTHSQLAVEMGISTHTLKAYLVRAYRFLGAVNAPDAVQKLHRLRSQAAETPLLPAPGSMPTQAECRIMVFTVELHLRLAARLKKKPQPVPGACQLALFES